MAKSLAKNKKYVLATYTADVYKGYTFLFDANDDRLETSPLAIIGEAKPVGKQFSKGRHAVQNVVDANGKEYTIFLGDRSVAV